MQKTKVLLFDIDGTLVHAGGAAARAFEQAFLEVFQTECSATCVQTAGRSDTAIQAEVVKVVLQRVMQAEESSALRARYLEMLASELEHEPKYRVLPGITELCRVLAMERVLLGLQTGNFKEAAQLKLRPGELDTYFSFGGFGCDSEHRVELVAAAIERAVALAACDRRALDVIVIGDTPHDISAAHANGCRCVAVASGTFSADELATADVVFEDCSDVRRLQEYLLS